jgi:pimeloyl-ACP methyl ester carboxylesterase
MHATEPQFVLLSGLGADERLFAAQKAAFPGLFTPRWIEPKPGEGLAEYAQRLAGEIPVRRPLILGGCSLGGMLAHEMAHAVRPEALVLIASAVTRDAIPRRARGLARIAWIVPTAGYGFGKRFAPPILSLIRGRPTEHRRLVAAMARDASSRFLRWACMAIGRWNPRPSAGVPTFVIHGDRDHILPLGRGRADYLVRGAGHLLTVTHAREVNAALREIIDRVAQQSTTPRATNIGTIPG